MAALALALALAFPLCQTLSKDFGTRRGNAGNAFAT
jgi:hypothetical protein